MSPAAIRISSSTATDFSIHTITGKVTWPPTLEALQASTLFTSCAVKLSKYNYLNTHTHTHVQISWYQKVKTNLDFTEARDSEWHQLGHMQVCTSLQTDNHASTPPLIYRPDALPAAQPTVSKH